MRCLLLATAISILLLSQASRAFADTPSPLQLPPPRVPPSLYGFESPFPSAHHASSHPPGPSFYRSAHFLPKSIQEESNRQAVKSLGVSKSKFVRCEFRNGKHLVGAITNLDAQGFTVSYGVWKNHHISYAELSAPPVHVAAVGEHIAYAVETTLAVAGITTLCIVAIPAVAVLMPLVITGVLQD